MYQRPQHLISRFSRIYRTIYNEEPVFSNAENGYALSYDKSGVILITPEINDQEERPPHEVMMEILDQLLDNLSVKKYILWYYTPMAVLFSRHLLPQLVVYDCMDELSAFKFAPPDLLKLEQELLLKADLVFTGGQSLFEHKKNQSDGNIFCFPSSIDKAHFHKAREAQTDVPDQLPIGKPRFGFFGVIDERFDVDLLADVAREKANWQFILIGPVLKIEQDSLPRASNIHYLGQKTYEELPAYIAGWDVAILPFAINESTRFISPTKTPEYLAAGKPVISTAIQDVVEPYGRLGFARIAANAVAFITHGEELLMPADGKKLQAIDAFLNHMSWDSTWKAMHDLMQQSIKIN